MKRKISFLLGILMIFLNLPSFSVSASDKKAWIEFSFGDGKETYQLVFAGTPQKVEIKEGGSIWQNITGPSPLDLTPYLAGDESAVESQNLYDIRLTDEEGTTTLQLNTSFGGGAGTEDDPYIVGNARHFSNVYLKGAACFLQTLDIDTGVNFQNMHQTSSVRFSGTYKGLLGTGGEKKEIRLQVTDSLGYSGAFGRLNAGALIENIKITGSISSANIYLGGIAGMSYQANIINCENAVNIDSTAEDAQAYAGGIIGYMDGGSIKNSLNSGNIASKRGTIGGIVGDVRNATVENCINNGTVLATNDGNTAVESYTGGIAGVTNASVTIDGCINHGIVENQFHSSANQGIVIMNGGICGKLLSTLTNCINSDNATIKAPIISGSPSNGLAGQIGGIVGRIHTGAALSKSKNFGAIESASSTSYWVGGVAGLAYAAISQCANLSSQITSRQFGGIVGRSAGIQVKESYNTGSFHLAGYSGGLASRMDANSSISDCFNIGDITGDYSGGIVGSVAGASSIKNTYTYPKDKGSKYAIASNGESNISGQHLYYVKRGAELGGSSGVELSAFALVQIPEGMKENQLWEKADDAFPLPRLKNNPYVGNFHLPELPVYDDVNFAGGYGTKEQPYLVETASHFNNINIRPDKHYKQTGNIDEEITQPIIGIYNADEESYSGFSGSYDGGNFSIAVNIQKQDTDMVGLFGIITGEATIKNLTVTGKLSGRKYTGAVVGISTGTSNNSKILNVKNYADVTAYGEKTGGLVGSVNESKDLLNGVGQTVIESCVNYGTVVQIFGAYCGGIAGVSNGSIVKCANYGNMTGISTVAGIVGFAYSTVSESFNVGNVTANSICGGIVGTARTANASITKTYNLGTIKGEGAVGIAASSNHANGGVAISYSYNAGPIIRSDGFEPLYQLNGENTAFINSCYYLTASGYEDDSSETTALTSLEQLNQLSLTGFNPASAEDVYPYPQIQGNPQTQAFQFALLTITGSGQGSILPNSSKFVKADAPFELVIQPEEGYRAEIFLNETSIAENIFKACTYSVPGFSETAQVVVAFEERPITPAEELGFTKVSTPFVFLLEEAEIVKNQSGFFTALPGESYGVVLSAVDEYYGWELIEYGVLLLGKEYPSETELADQKYGILFAGLNEGDYLVKPYAKYRCGEQVEIRYGKETTIKICEKW